MIYIKDMEMPVDCLACRISCKHESYMVPGRPADCPMEEAKTGDLIRRADAIEAVCDDCEWEHKCHEDCTHIDTLKALPSAEQVTGKLKNPCDSLLTEDSGERKEQKSKLESAEVAPKIDHDRDWIIGCIEHDGFIHTHRFDKANQIILDALSVVQGWIPCSERLPSEDGSYLVTSSWGKVYTAHYYTEHGRWQYNRRGLIEAWMPLPNPYKGGGSE